MSQNDTLLQLLQEKLAYFRREHIITADPSRKFQLENEIQDIDLQIKKLEYRESLPENYLQIALWKLNHSEQVDKFLSLSLIVKTIKLRT